MRRPGSRFIEWRSSASSREYLDEAETTLTADQRSHLSKLIAKRRHDLQEESFAYGERLLAEKPKRFVKRLERYGDGGNL